MGVGRWGSRALEATETESRRERDITCIVTDISNHVNGIFGSMGILLLERTAEPRSLERIANLRQEYQRHLEELRALISSSDDRRLMGAMEQAVGEFREINSHVIELVQSGRQSEASAIYRQRAVGAFEKCFDTVEAQIRYHERRLPVVDDARVKVQMAVSLAFSFFGLFAIVFEHDCRHRAGPRHYQALAGSRHTPGAGGAWRRLAQCAARRTGAPRRDRDSFAGDAEDVRQPARSA